MHRTMRDVFTLVALAALITVAGCHKKVRPTPPTPPPPPAAPTANLTASPSSIESGQSSTLTWQTTNATDVTINGQSVQVSGSQQVTPPSSSTYRLSAKGAGGTQEATARVTVTQPPPPPVAETHNPTEDEDFTSMVKDVYFDYDKYDVRGDQSSAVQSTAAFLKKYPSAKLTVEGHCDERGSTEYNLALGDNRARAAKDALTQMGIAADRTNPISFGKEKPFCSESNEQCWQRNRRAHFVLAR